MAKIKNIKFSKKFIIRKTNFYIIILSSQWNWCSIHSILTYIFLQHNYCWYLCCVQYVYDCTTYVYVQVQHIQEIESRLYAWHYIVRHKILYKITKRDGKSLENILSYSNHSQPSFHKVFFFICVLFKNFNIQLF